MSSGTGLCRGKVLSTLEHPCRCMVAELVVFMITGHKDEKYMDLHKKKMKGYGRTLFGVAYVSQVENQAKRSSYSFIIYIF